MPCYYLTGTSSKRHLIYRRPHQQQSRIMQAIEDRWVRMYSKTLRIKTAISTITLSKPLMIQPGLSPSLLRPAVTFKTGEVADLVARYGPPDTADLKGVANWLDYDERMRFIVTYFMVYQQVLHMFSQPIYEPKRSGGDRRREDRSASSNSK